MRFRQRDGHVSTLPLALNPGGSWRTVDTSTLSFLLPFAPPDLDTRKGTLFGLDLRSGSVVTYDPFDGAFLNANTVVMARSGAGKSFSTKLGLLQWHLQGHRLLRHRPRRASTHPWRRNRRREGC